MQNPITLWLVLLLFITVLFLSLLTEGCAYRSHGRASTFIDTSEGQQAEQENNKTKQQNERENIQSKAIKRFIEWEYRIRIKRRPQNY